MAAYLTADEIVDLTKGTLRELGRMKFQQIAQDLQRYEVLNRCLRKNKMIIDEGYGLQQNLMFSTAGAAAHVGMHEAYTPNITDLMQQMTINWVHAHTYWGFERRELLMNRGDALVFNIIKPRRAGAMIDLAKELESKFFGAPPATTDTHLPYNLKYWVVYDSSQSDGFNGGAPSGHTTVGGINPSTYPNWKNYMLTYTNVTKSDLLKKLRTALRKVGWRSPIDINDYRKTSQDMRFYTNEDVLVELETLGEAQNENIGKDLAAFEADSGGGGKGTSLAMIDGALTFRRFPIVWVPHLDTDTGAYTDALVGVDLSVFYPVVLKGDYLYEHDPKNHRDQPNTFIIHVDLTYNWVCVDRRRCIGCSK